MSGMGVYAIVLKDGGRLGRVIARCNSVFSH